MPNQWEGYGAGLVQGGIGQAASGLIGEGMGIAFQGIKNKQQLKQARRLQDLGLEAEATRLERNKKYALEMWEATGYGAQVDQMKRAGINPALLYGMSGGGGQTANIPSAASGIPATAATAQRSGGGEGMGLQAALIQAQIENIKADTRSKQVNADKTEGVDTDLGRTQIESLIQGITNAKTLNEIAQFEKRIKKVDANVTEQTEPWRMENIVGLAEQASALADTMQVDKTIAEETKDDKIKQIRAQAIGAILGNGKLTAETWKIGQEVEQKWAEIGIHSKEQQVKEFEALIKANYPSLWNVIGGAVNDVVEGINEVMGGKRKDKPVWK